MSRVAAVDIGTVTTRLLVADVTLTDGGETVREVERSTDITHLGEGLTSSGVLSPDAMSRVAETVARYASRLRELGVEEYLAIATSAVRDADNASDFLDLLASRGVRAEVVSGRTEARLTFAGATYGTSGRGLLVVDIGGGSTELILGDVEVLDGRRTSTPRVARSIDVGSRRLTEMFLRSDPPTAHELTLAREFTEGLLEPFFATLPDEPRTMISVAGTATTVAAITLGMPSPEYDPARVQDHVLSRGDVADTLATLAALPLAERQKVVGLHPARASVIVGGLVVLLAALDLAGMGSTRVSDRDILYGTVLEAFRRSAG